MSFRIAAIAGAGIGGLSAGLALFRRGWEVDICEKSNEIRILGSGTSHVSNRPSWAFLFYASQSRIQVGVESSTLKIEMARFLKQSLKLSLTQARRAGRFDIHHARRMETPSSHHTNNGDTYA
jgi:glycine/D-amino acid oxidase-like deaminating enzyme